MDTSIVGREHEGSAARAYLAGLRDGPRGLCVEGVAGIGKTALWRAIVAEAVTEGCQVLRCVAEQAETRMSFIGLADLIGDDVEDVLPELPPPQREALEVALLRRSSGQRRTPDPKAVGMAVRTVLVELAQARPVVVAVDDVQWLDGATARALAFAMRRLEGRKVGVLSTMRTAGTDADTLGLRRAFGADRVARVQLGPLSAGALRVLIEARLGHVYPRPTLLRIVEVSEGNPLFALEIADALGPTPDLPPGTPLPVPDSLRELVAARIAAVTPAARRSLLVASALSHPTVELVELASSPRGLLAAQQSALLRVADGRVTFAHPLYASAVYTSAARGRRRELHRRLIEYVTDPEEQVRHLALATSRPDEDVAVALDEAGVHARRRGAWGTAGELFEQAQSLTPVVRADAIWQRGVRAAEHHVHAGDRPRARALLTDILAAAPPGSTRSKALHLLAEIRHNEDSFAEAAQLLHEALENAGDRALSISLHTGLAHVYGHSFTHPDRADTHSARAVELAELFGDPALLAEAMSVRCTVEFLLGRGLDEARIDRALGLEDTDRLVPIQLRPSVMAALLLLYVGRLAEARERLETWHLAAVNSGDEGDIAFVLSWFAWLETLSGAFATAAAVADEAEVNAELTGSETNRCWAHAQRALAHAHLGDDDATRADAATATGIAHRLGLGPPLFWVGTALALLELSLDDPAAAWGAVAPLVERVEVEGISDLLGVNYLPEALEALILLGELERADRLLVMFERRAEELDRTWALATGARCRALLCAARADLDGANEAMERALGEHARLEMPFELGRTLLADGRIRRRRRQRGAAHRSFEHAAELFEQMSTRRWAELARNELARFAARRKPGDLTASERRVAVLAAEGLSNKEIARTLYVGVHTVEVHLAHAFAKLDLHSRSQLAARLPSESG